MDPNQPAIPPAMPDPASQPQGGIADMMAMGIANAARRRVMQMLASQKQGLQNPPVTLGVRG